MLRKLVVVVAWGCLAFIIYATLSTQAARPELTSSETALTVFIERFCAYALLGGLFRLAHPRRPVFVTIMVCGCAMLLEFFQIFVPDRDARLLDAIEKLAGGFVGISLADAALTFSGTQGWKMEV